MKQNRFKLKSLTTSTRKEFKNWKLYLTLSTLTLTIGIGGIYVADIVAAEQAYDVAVDYFKANDLYEYRNIKDELSENARQRFDLYLVEQAQKVQAQYQDELIIFEEARDQIKRIQSFSSQAELFETHQHQVQALNNSRLAYKEGIAYAREEDWESARIAFNAVIEEDSNYPQAQEALEQVSRWEISHYLIQAIVYFEAGDYEKSLTEIEKGLALSPGDSKFIELKADVEKAMIEDETPPTSSKWSEFKESLKESIKSGVESFKDKLEEGIHQVGEWVSDWWPFKKKIK